MRAGVLGHPIAHSLSPVMHNAAYAAGGLDWRYEAVDVPEGALAHYVGGVDENWRGFSVTAPLKREAAQFADSGTVVVEALGVANTLLRRGSGWTSDNTDVPGACAALAEAGVTGVERARILGGGATAAAMAHALITMGAQAIEVAVRNPSRAGEVVGVIEAGGARAEVLPLDTPANSAADLLISTVPVDATAHRAADWVAPCAALFDVVYDPWPTALATAGESAGIPVVSGLDLLAHQAVRQVELMTELSVTADVLRTAALAELGRR